MVKSQKITTDAVKDAGRYKQGDVIVALPIDHNYTDLEVHNLDWKILKIIDLDIEQAQLLIEPQVSFDGTFLRRRNVKLEYNKFNKTTVEKINDVSIRSVNISSVEITENILNKPVFEIIQENNVVVG